jgi:phospholipid/cholesterol/gamma-HCH transport system substrate-binding protein
LKIGLVTIFSLVMTAILIFLLSGQGGFPWQQYGLKTVFDNIAGLKEGAPVRVAGLEVGSVEALEFVGDRVEVVMKLRKDMQARVTGNSIASLGSVSLLGEAAVDITAAGSGDPVPEWGYVRSGPSAGSLTDVATRASSGIDEATALLRDIRAGRGTVGQLFANDSVYRDLNRLLSTAEELARNINEGKGTLGQLATNPATARALQASMENLSAMTARIRAGEGSLGRLLADDTMARSLTSTTTNLDGITGRMNRGEGTLGQLATNRELFDRLNSMTDRLDRVVASLQKGEGTAGQLLQDKQLYENMNTTVVELRATLADTRKLLAAIQADPKKYLNIRVSLF